MHESVLSSATFHIFGGGEVITIKATGDDELYHTNVCWTPDEKYILIAIVNRAQNHMWLNQYDASTGEFVKTLFEEKNDNND
mgnify:CR=1 FL=1